MNEFVVWLLSHWHTMVVVSAAVVVGVFLIYRHGAELLPGQAHNAQADKNRKHTATAAANEFLLVSLLILVFTLASRIEQVASQVSRDVDEIKKSQVAGERHFSAMSERIAHIDSVLPAPHQFELLEDYGAFVHAIEREVKRTQGRWLITRIQIQQATTRQEDAYFKAMVTRVLNEEIRDCRRIVRIESQEHLDRYITLMKQLGKNPYFGLSIWKPEEPPFNFEMLIGDDAVILAYGVGAPTWGIRIPDKGTADHFATTFDYMWNNGSSTEVIKGLRPLSDRGIEDVIGRMGKLFNARLMGETSQYSSGD